MRVNDVHALCMEMDLIIEGGSMYICVRHMYTQREVQKIYLFT